MGLRSTFRPRFGPFQVNTGRKGLTSIGLHLGPLMYRLWSRRGRTGVSSVDLPGPVSYRPSLSDGPGDSSGPFSLNPAAGGTWGSGEEAPFSLSPE